MLIRFFFGKRTGKDLEGTLRDARLRSAPGVTGLSLAPYWTRRGPDLNESDHKVSQRAEDCFAFDSGVRHVNEAVAC
jgi:hypothetical protein